ncbi:zygote arrest protein 1 [Microcebus murinus]|uniref:zygote arrest protein 1 n=1 Tax=Microcebus murinus TaxID=30608 RepID=UPI003F6B3C55
MAVPGPAALAGHLRPACAPCPPPAKATAKGAEARGHPPAAPPFAGFGPQAAAKLLDSLQRAQLVALLSQVGAGARRPAGRDAAVQVSPRADAAVQCSLGRRTLPRRPGVAGAAEGASRPPGRPEDAQAAAPGPPAEGPASARKAPPGRPGAEDDGDDGGEAVREAEAGEAPRSPGRAQDAGVDGGDGRETAAAGDTPSPRSPEQDKERLRFQFLEQKYGYYHCKNCNVRWESAYVWCVQGTNKVYFKQFCRTCPQSYNPYRVENITCQSCKKTRCSCPVKLRHVDPKRPHRQDLCGRCKGKRFSCDSAFSFKYVI